MKNKIFILIKCILCIGLFGILTSSTKCIIPIDFEPDFIFKTKLSYNIYGPNYQGYGPNIGKKFPICKNDKLTIEISGIANKDIPRMYFNIVDTSDSSSFWKDITPKNNLYIDNIVANEPFRVTFKTNAIATPHSYRYTKFVFMHEDNSVRSVKLTSCNIKLVIE